MPDDERTRRRVSDETKGRIADLASGWTVDPEPAVAPEPPPPAATPGPRRKARTEPPPAPGSAARKQLEADILDAPTRLEPEPEPEPEPARPPPARTKPVSSPPPIPPVPPARAKGTTQPPPIPAPPRTPTTPPLATAPTKPDAPVARSAAAGTRAGTEGEPIRIMSPDMGRPDMTALDPAAPFGSETAPFDRGDPTSLGGASTDAAPAKRPRAGRLRTVAALRRQRGVFGDIRYVATAVFGVRRARRELAELESKQSTRQAERERALITLGRTAAITDGFSHPALDKAREQLTAFEDARAQHAAQVSSADQELQRVTKDRAEKAKQYAMDLGAVDAELAELARRAEPLAKEQQSVTRRAADLRDSLRRLDARIAETTAAIASGKVGKKDPVAMQAELATLKADRESVKRDEPALAAELDGLSPRLAAIEAKKAESTKRRAELVKAEEDDQRRTEELLEAIGAKRKVMDRAANDAELQRDKLMLELGEQLYVDRPDDLETQLSPIEAIDVEVGSADRRMMELREILSSIDRWKLVRGSAYLAIGVVVLIAIVVGVLMLL